MRVAGWMPFRRAAHHAGHELGQLPGPGEGCRDAVGHDRPGDAARVTLLAQVEQDGGEIGLGSAVDDVGRRWAIAIHAHVERAVGAEREAALGLIELHGRHADVEHYAVERRPAEPVGHGVERAEARLPEREAFRKFRRNGIRRGARGRIAIEADHRRAGAQECTRVAARAECAIEDGFAARRLQRRQDFGEKDGKMKGWSASSRVFRPAAALHHSRASVFGRDPAGPKDPICLRASRTRPLASARYARKRSGSHN